MADEWVGIVNDTTSKYLKGASDATRRERLLLAMLTKRGRISYNHSGYDLKFQVEFAQPPIVAYGDGGVIEYSRHDVYRQLTLDWRGYKGTDVMTEKEKLMNKGTEALIKRYSEIAPNLIKSIQDKFGAELYVDGYASGNENRLAGLESFMGADTTYASVGAAAGDRVAKPGDTYAGKSTAVQNQGGSWSATLSTKPNASIATDWPDGAGTSEYDYITPKLINYSSTGWGTGSTTWEDNCERVIRQANIWTRLTSGKSGTMDLVMLSGGMFYDYANRQSAKQRIMVPHKEADDLGFSNVLNQEGLAIYYEFDVPAGVGYGLNLDQMELRSLSGELFSSRGPEYSMQTDSWLWQIGFFGNCWFNPKAFCKFKAYA